MQDIHLSVDIIVKTVGDQDGKDSLDIIVLGTES